MNYLLDTHLLLWSLALPERLPRQVRALADAEDNQAYASAVSVWEIAIKHARNKGKPDDMPITGRQAFQLSEAAHIPLLDIHVAHVVIIDDLPPVHGDPFDRLLIAQAMVENMILLTHDKQLAAYGDCVMVV